MSHPYKAVRVHNARYAVQVDTAPRPSNYSLRQKRLPRDVTGQAAARTPLHDEAPHQAILASVDRKADQPAPLALQQNFRSVQSPASFRLMKVSITRPDRTFR